MKTTQPPCRDAETFPSDIFQRPVRDWDDRIRALAVLGDLERRLASRHAVPDRDQMESLAQSLIRKWKRPPA